MTFSIAREHASRAIKLAHLALGAWLVVSAFVLRHSTESATNTWVMGLFIAVIALVALLGGHGLLRVNAPFAAWLLVSVWLVPYASFATQVHNAIVALAVLILSVVPAKYLVLGEAPEPLEAGG